MPRHRVLALPALACVLFLTACGGGGSGPDITVHGPPLTEIDANAILLSDLHYSFQGESLRVPVSCRPSGACTASIDGQTIAFNLYDDTDVDGAVATAWNTNGDWKDVRASAVYNRFDGIEARYAVALASGTAAACLRPAQPHGRAISSASMPTIGPCAGPPPSPSPILPLRTST